MKWINYENIVDNYKLNFLLESLGNEHKFYFIDDVVNGQIQYFYYIKFFDFFNSFFFINEIEFLAIFWISFIALFLGLNLKIDSRDIFILNRFLSFNLFLVLIFLFTNNNFFITFYNIFEMINSSNKMYFEYLSWMDIISNSFEFFDNIFGIKSDGKSLSWNLKENLTLNQDTLSSITADDYKYLNLNFIFGSLKNKDQEIANLACSNTELFDYFKDLAFEIIQSSDRRPIENLVYYWNPFDAKTQTERDFYRLSMLIHYLSGDVYSFSSSDGIRASKAFLSFNWNPYEVLKLNNLEFYNGNPYCHICEFFNPGENTQINEILCFEKDFLAWNNTFSELIKINDFKINLINQFENYKMTQFLKIILIFLFALFFELYNKYKDIYKHQNIEFPLLIILVLLPSLLIFNLKNFINLVLIIESINLATYVLVGHSKLNKFSAFSGIQFLILSSVMSVMFIFGISIIYRTLGTFQFDFLFSFINIDSLLNNNLNNIIFISSIFIFFMFLFKLTVAPFHTWALSVYVYSPLPTMTFLSIFSKIFMLTVINILITNVFYNLDFSLLTIIIILSLFTTLISVLGAISESITKKFLVYSSMSHVSFMLLISFLSNDIEFEFSLLNYFIFYITVSFGVFAILLSLNNNNNTYLINFNILNKNKILAICLTLLMFSMAGIPPLSGFFAKYYAIVQMIYNDYFWVSILLLILSVISAFYYLKVIKIVFFESNKNISKTILYKELNENRMRLIVYITFFTCFYSIFI